MDVSGEKTYVGSSQPWENSIEKRCRLVYEVNCHWKVSAMPVSSQRLYVNGAVEVLRASVHDLEHMVLVFEFGSEKTTNEVYC